MIKDAAIRVLEETLENLVAKHNLSAYTTRSEPVSPTAETEVLHFDVHWQESAETILKKTILSRNMEQTYLTGLLKSLSFRISDQLEKIFLEHLYQTAEVRNVSMPGYVITPMKKKEFVVDQISALVYKDFKNVASPAMIECVMSDSLENQICANSQFRIANFPKETRRMITDSMYVNISEHIETTDVLAFAYEYTYFPRPQIEVAPKEDNILYVDLYLQNPNEPIIKPILYVFS